MTVPSDCVMYCPCPALEFSDTDESAAEKVGVGEAQVLRVADPPLLPSFVHEVPEIFDALAVNETSGEGTAAFADGIEK